MTFLRTSLAGFVRQLVARGMGLAVAATALSLAACAPGEVQLEGKVFDMLGVNASSEREAPKLKERNGLVVPPSLARLPEPGKPAESQDTVLALIDDPDRKKVVDKEKLAEEQAKYCAQVYEPAKARGDPDAESIAGPMGPCRKSALDMIGGAGSLFGNIQTGSTQ